MKVATTAMDQEADEAESFPTLGILGGGQLARMTAMAATRLGCEVAILERRPASPAAAVAGRSILGDWDDAEAVIELGRLCDVLTLENEFVSADALEQAEREGIKIFPRPATVRMVQDKLWQKEALQRANLPLLRFAAVEKPADLHRLGSDFGWPLVLKKRRNGYDGKGNVTLRSPEDIDAAWAHLGGASDLLYAEEFCHYDRELAVMIVRNTRGETAQYPIVESVQRDHICHLVKAPARVPESVAREAAATALKAVECVDAVGAFGVEMFLTSSGEVLINELAPRVHNSGHYTIEACVCSQFENHVRAVMGWPLGSTAMVAPAAAMVNLLGQGPGSGVPDGLDEALQISGAYLHIYGKAQSAKGRKMGHVTALGESLDTALLKAQTAARALIFGKGT